MGTLTNIIENIFNRLSPETKQNFAKEQKEILKEAQHYDDNNHLYDEEKRSRSSDIIMLRVKSLTGIDDINRNLMNNLKK